MNIKRWQAVNVSAFCLTAAIAAVGSFAQEKSRNIESVWGSKYSASRTVKALERHPFIPTANSTNRLKHWNEVAINASGLDHTPVALGEDRVFGEQLGPGRSSRAMAIVHIAIFDAVNALDGKYTSYTGIPKVTQPTSADSAIAQAAHDTLVALFPSQTPALNQQLSEDLAAMPDGPAKTNGIALGQTAAAAILALRSNDHSQHPEDRVNIDFITSNDPGKWRQDPISLNPLALGSHWGRSLHSC